MPNITGYYLDILGAGPKSNTFAQLDLDMRLSAAYSHYMFGDHTIYGSLCPNCQRDLTHILCLDLADPRLVDLTAFGKSLRFYYCLACDLQNGEFCYQLNSEGALAILAYCAGEDPGETPWAGYRRKFTQAKASLLRYSNSVLDKIEAWHSGTTSILEIMRTVPELAHLVHQVGGLPYLVQRVLTREMICPLCFNKMPFVATICDDTIDTEALFGNTFAQIIYHVCVDCCVVGAVMEVD